MCATRSKPADVIVIAKRPGSSEEGKAATGEGRDLQEAAPRERLGCERLRLDCHGGPPLCLLRGCARDACRLMDGLPDAQIGAATAEVAAHGRVDLGIRGVRRVLE